MPYLVKKLQFWQNYIIGWAKKVNSNDALFFPIFHEKITTLMPTFCQKNVHSLKNTLFSCPYFVKKTSILSKTPSSQVFFFIFHVKPNAVMPIFGENNVNSVTTTLDYGPKKSIGCPFFLHFSRKNHYCHALILPKKHPFSKKHAAFTPIFFKNRYVYYLKNTVLSCHIF